MDLMDIKLIALKLEQFIVDGEFALVKSLLDNAPPDRIRLIEKQFPTKDPLVLAIDTGQEDIAIFLLEKGFSYSTIYTYESKSCDQWCYNDHSTDRCPSQYDALELSRQKALTSLHSILLDIHNGVRKPGDGLASVHIPYIKETNTPVTDAEPDVHIQEFPAAGDKIIAEAEVYRARQWIQSTGTDYRNKNGGTLMHEAVLTWENPSVIWACASMHVPVNEQDSDGNTALHVAVQLRKAPFVKALLSAGADLVIRNKKGQTAEDESLPPISELLEMYKPGLVQAVTRGHPATLQRLIRRWCHPDSNIKAGESAMQLLANCAESNETIQRCYNLMQVNYQKLQFIHATLSGDIKTLEAMLTNSVTHCHANVRFKDKYGWTPVCHVIAQQNLPMLRLLLRRASCNLNIRIRQNDDSLCSRTMPLYFLTLNSNCPTPIWKLVCQHMDTAQGAERDTEGRTALMRAIDSGRSAKFIEQMITRRIGQNLLDRNKDGLSVRAMARSCGIASIVQVIDKYICEQVTGNFLIQMVINFHGDELQLIEDKESRSLLELLKKSNHNENLKIVKSYEKVEEMAEELFRAAVTGDLETVTRLNKCNYKDKNGFTALIRAIVFNQPEVVNLLITDRPALKSIPDNHNRYPLHYAYAMPEDVSQTMVKILFDRCTDDTEHKVDKLGREAADYKSLRNTEEIREILHDVRTLDVYQKRGGQPFSEKRTTSSDLITPTECT